MIRKCTKEYIIPDTGVKLDVGTQVLLPVYALQNDPDYYPEPEKFDPDRFNEINKNKAQPFTYLPFGEGPRICIGKFLTVEIILNSIIFLL